MSLYIHNAKGPFVHACVTLAVRLGFEVIDEPHLATAAIAPLLRRRLSVDEWSAPAIGTLIFHPSALPYRRGPDAIKHAIAAGERVSAATWFWCTAGLDEGPICEQELVVLHPEETPREAYERRFMPAGLRALGRALEGIRRLEPRRVLQEAGLATYDGPLQRRTA